MCGHTVGASPSRLALAATKIGSLETPVESPRWDFSDYNSYYRLGMKHGRKAVDDELRPWTEAGRGDQYRKNY